MKRDVPPLNNIPQLTDKDKNILQQPITQKEMPTTLKRIKVTKPQRLMACLQNFINSFGRT